MIEVTRDLLRRVVEAEDAHFGPYCDLKAVRKPGDELLRRERAAWDGLHVVVEELREHFAELVSGEHIRQELMRRHVEGQLALDARIRQLRRDHAGKAGLDRVRQDWVEERFELVRLADAAWVGCGWPHRLEAVVVTASWYETPAEGEACVERVYEGEALYLDSYSTENTLHQVELPDGHDALIGWEPTVGGTWGKADPSGDIPMRVAASPRRLPVPLPRWPEPEDCECVDPFAGVAVGEQLALEAAA